MEQESSQERADRQARRALRLVETLRAFETLEQGGTPDRGLYVARLGPWLEWRAGLYVATIDDLVARDPIGFLAGDDLSRAILRMCEGNSGFLMEEVCEDKKWVAHDLALYGVDVHLHAATIERFWPQYERCRRARGF